MQTGDTVVLTELGKEPIQVGDKTFNKTLWDLQKYEPIQDLPNTIAHDSERERQGATIANTDKTKQNEQDTPITPNQPKNTPNLSEFEWQLPSNIKNNYIAITKNRFLQDEKVNYYDKNDKDQVNIAFEDRANGLHTSRQDEKTIHAMLDLAQSKGWSAIKLKGTEEFKQKAWLEASLRGIEVKGYTPTEKDLAELQAKQQARTTNQVEMTAQKPPQTKEYSEHNHENHQKQPSINEAFNQQLQDLIDGKLNEKHIFQLGKPSDILLNTGFPNTPIELKASKLWEKSQADWHKFDIASAKDLPRALQEPMAVFAYGDKNKSQNVITEIEHDGKKFVVGVHFNQMQDGVEINSVRGFFPKDNPEWLNWIAQDKALYLDKEKVQTLIAQQRTNLADVSYLDLNLVTSIVKNFDNVKQNIVQNAQEHNREHQKNIENFNTEPTTQDIQKSAQEIKNDIRQIAQNGYQDGSIKSRDDLVAILKERGYEIKAHEKYVRVSLPNSDQFVNLKGEVFTKDYAVIKDLKERLEPEMLKQTYPNLKDSDIVHITAYKNKLFDDNKDNPNLKRLQASLVQLENGVKEMANGKAMNLPALPVKEVKPDIEVRTTDNHDKSRQI